MMTKLLSLVLSFTILFTTVAPSYAQARNAQRPARVSASDPSGVQDSASLERVNPGLQISQRVMEAQREQIEEKMEVNRQLMPIVEALSQDAKTSAQAQGERENSLDYDTYEKEYLAQIKELERKLLRGAKSAEEQRLVKEKIAELRTDSAIALQYGLAEEQYEKYLNEHSKELEKDFKKAMEPYVKLALANYKESAVAGEMLFFALGMGMISPKDRKNIANFYHRSLKKYMSSCGELSFWDSETTAKEEQRKCEQALQFASYLAGFGEEGDYSKDAELLKEFLLVGYKGIAAPAVLQTVASGLLALKAESQLENALMIIRREVPYSPIDVTLSIFSVETWVEMFQNLSNSDGGFGTAQFAEGFEYSYYPTPEENGVKYKNKSNMWLDLGVYLAEIANNPNEERRRQVRSLLDSILSDCIGFDNYGNLQIGFRPFVVGVLAGGYEVPSLSRPSFAPVLQRDGSTYVPSPEVRALRTKAWKNLSRVIKQSGFTNNQYISWYLYNLKKIDLDPETARYINNVLTSAFVTSGKKAGHVLRKEVIGDATRYQIGYNTKTNEPMYMESRKHPTAADMSAYQNRQSWKKVGFAVDIVLVVVAIFTLGATLVKSGLSLLRTGTRVLKLARAGRMFAGGSLRINTLRVLSRARAVKGLPVFKNAASATVRDIVGLERLKIEPAMKEIRAARAAKKATTAVKVAAPQVQFETRFLNGKYHMVPEGMETFYVRGQVQYVTKGTQPAELAKQFGVDVSEVVLAKNGSVAPKPALSLRNYSTGDGVNGATGSQPLVSRPETVPAVNPGETAVKLNVPVAEQPAVRPVSPVSARQLTRWQELKLRAALDFQLFKENLALATRFAWKHPVKTMGAAGSSWGFGGVAPVAIYAEAPATASQVVSFGETSARLLSATRAAETAGAVSTATSAGAEMAGAIRAATQLGGGWSNPFWGEGLHVTDWRFLTPVGALPSAGRNAGWNREFSKWSTQEAFKQHQTRLNQWLFVSDALQRQINPWFARDTWKDFSVSLTLSYQEWRMLRAGNRYYLNSLKESGVSSTETTVAASADTQATDPDKAADTPAAIAPETETQTSATKGSTSGVLYSGIPVMAIWKMISRMPSLAKEFSADVVKWFSPRASEDTFVAPTVTTPTKTSLPRSHVTTPVATVPAATPQVNPNEGTTPDWDGNATVNLDEDNTLYLDEEGDKRDLTFEAEASVYGNAFLDAFGEPGSVDGDEEDPWQDADATSEWDDWAAQADDDDPFSSSGILYSGIPVMELEKIWTEAYNGIVRILSNRVDTYAQDVLNRKNPLLTELRDIVTGDASRKWKEQALLRLHKQFNVFSAVIGHLPVESRNKFNALKQNDTKVTKFLYNLYSTGQLDNVLASLNNHIPVDELSKQLEQITSTPEFDAARRKVYDETARLPFDANDWQGYVETVQDVDKGLIEGLFRPAGWAAQSAADGKEVSGGKVYYENDIPVYYRNSKGELSAHPVIILHQEVLSSKIAEAYAAFLSKLGLSTKKGISIPKGMVLALDENGRFKYVLQPGHRAELLSSKSGKKMNEDIYANGSSPVDLTTPYSTTDLLAVAKLLEAGVAADFQLTVDAPNSFKPFVNLLGANSGLGADTVMVGPFKEAAGPENPAVPNAFGGTGYVTPRVAAATVDDMKTWGVARSVMLLLSVTLVTLLVSVGIGINGFVPKEEFSLLTLAFPLLVLITAGSLLRSVIPLILKAYKDPRQYTAANLDVSTWQQGSKLAMFGLTAAWYGLGGKFVAVPIAAVLVLATLGLFFNTPQGRKVISETITAFKDHPKESFKAMGKGSLILAKDLLKGFVKGIFAPVFWGGKKVKAGFKWTANKLKSSRKTTAPSAGGAGSEAGVKEKTASPQTDEERYRDEYEKSFKKLPEVKAALSRVSLAYASYAASVMMANQLAESDIILALFGGIGRYITFAFSLASFLVRFFASKWVKSGKFTDDQLTGISFAGLALTALGLAGAPFTGGIGLVVVVLLGVMLNASTAVPGQLDQARLQNLVSAMVQSQKNEVLQDKSLSPAEREAQIADLEAKESKWSGWAKADYDNANANGIWGVYAATGTSVLLPYLGIDDWSWIARTVFAYAGIVAGLGALKTGSQSLDFIKALFSRNHTLVVTAEDIADGKVNADTFGVTDENKANKVVPSLLKGKDSLKTLQEQLMPYGVAAISSEVKLTKVLKRLIEIHNRFVASAEKLGDEALHASFEQVLAVAKDFESVLKRSNVSESLRREFEKLLAALCVNGSLDQGVLSHPAYMEEGSFAMPSNYRNLLEARDIINELKQLATNIEQGGAAVNANTYSQFVQYHAEAKRLLQTYAAENPSESLIVRVEEERIRLVCLGLKNANALHNVLRAHAGQTPAKDIQNLEDILRVYEGDMQISSEWALLFQSETREIASFFNAHPGLAQAVEEMMHSVDAETLKEILGLDEVPAFPLDVDIEDVIPEIIQGTGNAAALKISSQSELQALFIAPLEQALQLKQQGLPVDEDTQSEIADLYQRADQAMTQYLNAHPKEGKALAAMRMQLDKLYTQIIGEAPTKEKVAELAKKSSGLMSMVDWFGQLWEDLLAWFKDGDDSPGANDGSGDLSALPSTGGGAVQLARLPGKKEVDAVIFDMDGTLLNTLWAWKNSTSNFLRSRGIEPLENIDAEMAALSLLEGARVLKERYGFKESPEELLEEVLATVRKFYEEDAMPKPGVPGVLQALKKQGIKICVATASAREFAEAAFKRTGLMEYIDFIITCDEVGVGKQNPLVYETALKKLGTDRKRTLVVEDALHALQTAKKAGFPTAGVYEVNFAADQSALQSDATYYVPSFQTVAVGN